MGLFSFNKRYTLTEAKHLLQTKKYKNYTAILVDEEKQLFKLEQEEKAMLEARSERLRQKSNEQMRTQFLNRINGEGSYSNITTPKISEISEKNSQNYLDWLDEAR